MSVFPRSFKSCNSRKNAFIYFGNGSSGFGLRKSKKQNEACRALFFSVYCARMFCFFIPSLKSRLMEVQDFFISGNFGNTLTERMIIFNCGRSVFLSDFLTGIGARNVQGIMDYCYIWFGFHKGAIIHLNPHNQYLSLGIAYGIGILFLFLQDFSCSSKGLKTSGLPVFFICPHNDHDHRICFRASNGGVLLFAFSTLFLHQSQQQRAVYKSMPTPFKS